MVSGTEPHTVAGLPARKLYSSNAIEHCLVSMGVECYAVIYTAHSCLPTGSCAISSVTQLSIQLSVMYGVERMV